MSYRDRPKWLTVGRWQPVFPGYVRLLFLRYVVKHVVYFKALKLTFSSTGMSHRLILKFVYFVSLHLNTSYTSLRQTIRLLLSRACLTYTYALKSLFTNLLCLGLSVFKNIPKLSFVYCLFWWWSPKMLPTFRWVFNLKGELVTCIFCKKGKF